VAWLLFLAFSFVIAGCGPAAPRRAPHILLFSGTGASPNDVKAIKAILDQSHLDYAAVDSRQLNGMSESDLSAFRLIIIPGGNFVEMGNGLTPEATATIRSAVQGGVNYLGICAGGFLAGDLPYNCLNLTGGVRFGFYSEEKRGVRKAAVVVSRPGKAPLEHYWEDGPEFSGWGAVVGRYPDGTPAVVQGSSGKGWVLLCGVHPEAPASWRNGLKFTTPVSDSNAYAASLIDAALHRAELPHD
jgi:glutamine amidotransferase-like uncharacterized protein